MGAPRSLDRIVCRRGFGAYVAMALALATTESVTAAVVDVRVAVATNFRDAVREIGTAYKALTARRVVFSFGSTGQLYAQIAQGAPFDIFLAADRARVTKAIDAQLAVADSRFTYAIGRLVLFSSDSELVAGSETLLSGRFGHLAIADPVSAPYGTAAVEVLRQLGCYDRVRERIVRGLNVAQAFQFVHSGNAELGLVALSQVVGLASGSRWIVPERLHAPIKQDAVLLRRGASNPAALEFIRFLRGPEADAVRAEYGYASEDRADDVRSR